ncbi:MAG: hypothetical protein RMJ51_05470 [Candidatus Calescibacterium sp.]|nr:hypothetical protein [Candidatus Calescibacterium sp.]MCX7972439.1 hypothetical protein [bacterium]MDW8195670.1 hypothetical protein [Candidatus Calescibacterium sp.]
MFFFKKQKEKSKISEKEAWKFRGKNCPFAKKVKKVKDNKVQEIFMCYGYIEKFELDSNFETCKKCSIPEIITTNSTACKNLTPLDMKGKNGTTRYYCQVLKIKDLETNRCLPQFCNYYELRPQDQRFI